MINAIGLRKRFGETALDDFHLHVPKGVVFGLLGSNGAGKTTAVRILTTLLRPDAGEARIAGFDAVTQSGQVRRNIGLVGQYAALDEVLSGRQNLVMFGRLFHLGAAAARQRADELLERFRLEDTGNKPVKTYSGGMRRRLDLAASLILAPPVLFLDEPTTGLDPRGRNEVWESVRTLAGDGTTVLLTTQYLEEADQLADRIAVVDHGKVIIEGSPDELKSGLGGDRIHVVLHTPKDLGVAAGLVTTVTGHSAQIDEDNRRISSAVDDRMAALTRLLAALDDAGVVVEDIGLRRPTLDEVFLQLTDADKERA